MHTFDSWTRSLATASSRRSLVRAAIGGIAGFTAAGSLRNATAQNSEAAEFCRAVFGPGPQRGDCISAAVSGGGLFYECGGDLANLCPGIDPPTCDCGACIPTISCASAGAECGAIIDDCGTMLSCGECAGGEVCSDQNHCSCVPLTSCEAQGFDCGTLFDGCGDVPCGSCTEPETCGGGGVAKVCGCTPTTCEEAGASCGSIPNGCGGTIDCGPCACAACTPVGGSCLTPDACCSGFCLNDTCVDTPELGCRQTGDICSDDFGEGCCAGTCSSGCCTCAGTAGACTSDGACCLGHHCSQLSLTCCKQTDEECTANAECCGGYCVNGECQRGSAGTPCRGDGECLSIHCDDSGLCACSTDSFCFTNADCCAGYVCADVGFTEPPFNGTCTPASAP